MSGETKRNCDPSPKRQYCNQNSDSFNPSADSERVESGFDKVMDAA